MGEGKQYSHENFPAPWAWMCVCACVWVCLCVYVWPTAHTCRSRTDMSCTMKELEYELNVYGYFQSCGRRSNLKISCFQWQSMERGLWPIFGENLHHISSKPSWADSVLEVEHFLYLQRSCSINCLGAVVNPKWPHSFPMEEISWYFLISPKSVHGIITKSQSQSLPIGMHILPIEYVWVFSKQWEEKQFENWTGVCSYRHTDGRTTQKQYASGYGYRRRGGIKIISNKK